KSGALALVTMGLSPTFLRRTAFGMELFNAPKGKVLICLFQRGAADALNIVVPHGEKAYYAMRPSIAIPQPSRNAIGGAIDLDGFSVRATGSSAERLEALYRTGSADLVHGTGAEMFDAVKMLRAANPQKYLPQNGADYPRSQFGLRLLQIAQLIKANVGLEIA